MKIIRAFLIQNARSITIYSLGCVLLALILLYHLGSLTHGLSAGELNASGIQVGLHGIYHEPLFLPLKVIRSIVFKLFKNQSPLETRLPNAFFGFLTICIFYSLIRLWHGKRTAFLAGILFATSAWILHVSRIASYDVMYLIAIPSLLLINRILYRYTKSQLAWYISLLWLILLLYVPGLIWLISPSIYFISNQLGDGWKNFSKLWQRAFSVALVLLPLVLLIIDLTRRGQLVQWLGLPSHLESIKTILKQFLAVPLHLLIRGPQYPALWLGRAMILDIFTLAMFFLGIYFYARHISAPRSQMLVSFLFVGWILIALGGPVTLSLLIPLLYIVAAMGISYFMHEWFKVFPLNPLVRGLGVSALSLMVIFACIYNMQSYFVAWPNNSATKATFVYRR
jgi:hypothetical protein